jgi:hypothetical protein
MALTGIQLAIIDRAGTTHAASFTIIENISLDREGTGTAGTTTAVAKASIYSSGNNLKAVKEPIEEFMFEFTYTSPCPCNGITPCGEGLAPCPDGCGCIEAEGGGVCAGAELGNTTCTDVWDEALIACKALTAQTQLDGVATAYNYTTGSYVAIA